MGINQLADVAKCRLPRGVPLCQPIFYLALLAAQHHANHTSTMMFSASSNKITLPHLQLGRQLCSAKCAADTLPLSGRASVYCCLPRRLIAHEQTTPAIFAAKNI
jgi:hypothetical protein